MIIAEHLNKKFTVREKKGFLSRGKRIVEAVADVSLKIEPGAIVGLLGINGAGKTTTIKMLTTLLQPTAGTYSIDGIDAIKNPRAAKRAVNMVAGGERMIYWRLTAWENLWYFGQIYGVEDQVLKERIVSLLELVGLEGKEHIPVETFSKGMKQRLQIARGLINDPCYLFMDEPTIGLDVLIAKELRDHVKKLAKEEGKGILLTSHYIGEVEELCDYIYILNKGRLIHQGTSKELSREVFKEKLYIIKTYGDQSAAASLLRQSLTGAAVATRDDAIEISCADNISVELSEICSKNRIPIRELYEKEPKFEDVIVKFSREA